MLLRMSTLFLRTLRDDPADAELASHKLLVRAGYIRRAAPGIYTWLPLGLQVLRNVEQIVREEMDALGAQELSFPALLAKEPYEKTGRWVEYGDNLFRLQDRKGNDYLLGPTHEEMFTLAVKDLYSSYKDLPVSLYQIQTKYRDEARPRAGLLRGREFVMKDSYSFDIDDAGLQKSYVAHREAYIRIFDRLQLEYVICAATSGAMGGSASEEFLALLDDGEDTFVRTDDGSFAANVEAVVLPPAPEVDASSTPAPEIIDTPQSATIDALIAELNSSCPRSDGREWAASDTLKNVVIMTTSPSGERAPLVVGVPGDRDVDLKRLEAQLVPLEVAPMEDRDFAQYPQLVRGYIGPQVLGEACGIRYLLDPSVAVGSEWVTGANKSDQHVMHLVNGRDFFADGVIQAVAIRDGDPAPDGHGVLHTARGVEMGHIFQLGTKYAEALDLKVLDENGKLVTVTMGSYGIGVSRAVAAIAQTHHDEFGLVWPRDIAPADIIVVAAGKSAEIAAAAIDLAKELDALGLNVIVDDRPKLSPGVKFKDAELIGIPYIATVGKRLAVDGVVELKTRASGERVDISRDNAATDIAAAVRN